MHDEAEGESERPNEEGKRALPVTAGSRPGARAVADVGAEGQDSKSGNGDSWVTNVETVHPSRKLEMRAGGYGIAAGYEKPYKRRKPEPGKDRSESYGPIPHSGYYGAGEALRPFKVGQAGFDKELEWYRSQYGSKTSGYKESK